MHPGIDWELLITVVTVSASFIAFIFRVAVGGPIKGLQNSIDKLTERMEKSTREIDDRLDKHELKLERHDERINTLFNLKQDKD